MPVVYKPFWVKQSRKADHFDDIYSVGDEIGRGPSDSVVYYCQRRGLQEEWAVKVIDKKVRRCTFRPADAAVAVGIKHHNLAYLRDVFESRGEIRLVQELLTGGQLYHRLESLEPYNEVAIAGIVKQIMAGLAYLHSVELAHRNLKPENIRFASDAANAPLKICDYGLSSMARMKTISMHVCGSTEYTAPEVLKGDIYTRQCDLWSLGVIVYTMLCGYLPFQDNCLMELYKKIIKGRLEFHSPDWDDISDDGKAIVKALLRQRPGDRMSAEKGLRQSWVNGICANQDADFAHLRNKMRELNGLHPIIINE